MDAKKGHTAVLASVVALDGSSYRRPGVRMLILDNKKMIGAVSGGCVEKEILRQSESVFSSGIPRLMVYDGRYRLGCEGILYILIEPFNPSEKFLERFWEAIRNREDFRISSYFEKGEEVSSTYGSIVHFLDARETLRPRFKPGNNLDHFEEFLEPCFRLVVIGAEHDAVQLCTYASLTGWEVSVVANPAEEKSVNDFPGAHEFVGSLPENFDAGAVDDQTAVLLMTHSYVKDLKYLIALKECRPAYLGLLGPSARREKMLNELLEHCPEMDDWFFENLHGPSGLNIGAETPQEIAIAIISEILAVVRNQEPIQLRTKKGAIHS